MTKYTQEIIFSIPGSFEIKDTFIGKMALDVVISKYLEPYVKENRLEIKEATGERVWNTRDPEKKYYFIGGTNIDSLIKDSGIDIILEDVVKEEQIS